MSRLRFLAGAIGIGLAANMAAADRALVIGPEEPERRGLLRSGSGEDTATALRDAGFDVVTANASSISGMRQALSDFMSGLGAEERSVIHLSGRFVTGGGQSWLLQAGDLTPPDLATVGDVGLSLETVLVVAGRVAGASVVALGATGEAVKPGDGLKLGAVLGAIPQGVTIAFGSSDDVAGFVANDLLQPGQSLREIVTDAKGITVDGFLSLRPAFVPEGEQRPVATPDAAEVERAIWQATQAQDSIEAYEGYVEKYPGGFFVPEAARAIEAIRTEPDRNARQTEEQLDLSRDNQRRVQSQLTLLDYNPKGVDGVFGPATRAAISRFQEKNGFPASGYLDSVQLDRLVLQAERRQAELEAEAKRQALEREKRDREDWAALSENGDEAGIRTYLTRHPNGIFAPIAEDWVERIETQRRANLEEQDRKDWQTAQEAGTITAYRAYLQAHPDGAFSGRASDLIEERSETAPDVGEGNAESEKDSETDS